MTKIRNKRTGEIIDLSGPKQKSEVVKKGHGEAYLEGFNRRVKETDEKISNRGTIQGKLKSEFEKPELMGKLAGTLRVIGAPLNAIESAISNPALLAQQGNFSPKQLLKEAVLGATLQKQGQFGDVLINRGVQKDVAAATGLVLSIGGAAEILKGIVGVFGKISKLSDKKILLAGSKLIKGSKLARKVLGTKVGQAFSKVDDVAANGAQFIDDVVALPKSVLTKAEQTFGNLDDFAEKLTVGKLREFKRFLGKLRPTAFGKAERGVAENIDVMDLNKVYSSTKKLLTQTIKEQRGEKVANNLMKLEESFSEVVRAGDFIKKSVIDPTLRQATKGGSVAVKLAKEGDVTTRSALNALRSVSNASRKEINKSIALLNSFNRAQKLAELGKKGLGAAVFGGAAGAIGGKALRKVSGQE